MTRATLRRLHERYLGIAESCELKPRPFADASYDDTRMSYARPVLHAMQALDAARTVEGKRRVIDNFGRYMQEAMAILKARLRERLTLTMREAFMNAQRDDVEEDVCETAYLLEPNHANRERLIQALQRQQQSASIVEMHLRAEDGAERQSAPLRRA